MHLGIDCQVLAQARTEAEKFQELLLVRSGKPVIILGMGEALAL